MVDVYDRVTGRNDERKTLETRVAELGVEEAEHKSAGIDGNFKLRERVRTDTDARAGVNLANLFSRQKALSDLSTTYRVDHAHLLVNLGWVDCDLGCSTILLGQ